MKRKKQRAILLILYFIIAILLSATVMYMADRHFMPPLKEISHMKCKNLANEIIDSTVSELLSIEEYSSSPFFTYIGTEEGYQTDIVLLNRFCSDFSKEINDKLIYLSSEKINIPIGTVTKIDFLANTGPEIPFVLVPMGNVKIDYNTTFTSAGINQIHYQIWLDLSMEIKIVNPLYDEFVQMERKILLADVVYSGNVPSHYFQIDGQNEYLLTE